MIHSLYNLPPDPGITFRLPTMTQQHFREECDINNIMARYAQTGLLPQHQDGIFVDLANNEWMDYREALHVIQEADEAFSTLPASFRSELGNNPANFIDWISDPTNENRAIKMGFMVPRDSAPLDVTVTTDTEGVKNPSPTLPLGDEK